MAEEIGIGISQNDVNIVQQITNGIVGLAAEVDRLSASLSLVDKAFSNIHGSSEILAGAFDDAFSSMYDSSELLTLSFKDTSSEFQEMMAAADEFGKNLSSTMQQAAEDTRALGEEQSRLQNKAGGNDSEKKQNTSKLWGIDEKTPLGMILKSDIPKNLASAAMDFIGSQFEDESVKSGITNIGGGVLTGIIDGAKTGGIGGAVVGGISGLVTGILKHTNAEEERARKEAEEEEVRLQAERAKRNEYFVQTRNDLVQGAMQAQVESVSGGSVIAASREQLEFRYAQMLGDDAEEFISSMTAYANALPYTFEAVAGVGAAFSQYGYAIEDLESNIAGVVNAAALLGWDEGQMQEVAYLVGMVSQSGASDEIMAQLQSHGIDTQTFLDGLSPEAVMDTGLMADELLAYLSEEFGGGIEALRDTFLGMQAVVDGLEEQIAGAYGEGYNEKRMEGMQAREEFLTENGEQLSEANRVIGEMYAYLENEQERLRDEYLQKVMGSDEYQSLMAGTEEDRVQAAIMLEQAKIDAQIAYAETDGAQQLRDMELSLIEETSKSLVQSSELHDSAYAVGEAYGTGMKEAVAASLTDMKGMLLEALSSMGVNTESGDNIGFVYDSSGAVQAAWGLPYVPYDNYPVRLHEGERVLTAAEARGYGTSPNVTIDGVFHVREEADVYKIAQELASRLERVMQVS